MEPSEANAQSSPGNETPNTLFVGNLAYSCSADDLRKLFETYGEVKETKVHKSTDGKTLYFGRVTMANEADTNKAKDSLNGCSFMGRKLIVESYKRNSPSGGKLVQQMLISFRGADVNVRIVNEDMIRHHFQPYGHIMDVCVKQLGQNNLGHVCGYGFLTYADYKSCYEAAQTYSQQAIDQIEYDCQWSTHFLRHYPGLRLRDLPPGFNTRRNSGAKQELDGRGGWNDHHQVVDENKDRLMRMKQDLEANAEPPYCHAIAAKKTLRKVESDRSNHSGDSSFGHAGNYPYPAPPLPHSEGSSPAHNSPYATNKMPRGLSPPPLTLSITSPGSNFQGSGGFSPMANHPNNYIHSPPNMSPGYFYSYQPAPMTYAPQMNSPFFHGNPVTGYPAPPPPNQLPLAPMLNIPPFIPAPMPMPPPPLPQHQIPPAMNRNAPRAQTLPRGSPNQGRHGSRNSSRQTVTI